MKKILIILFAGFIGIEGLGLAVSDNTETSGKEENLLMAPEQGVVMSLNRKWRSTHWAGDIRARNISLDMEREAPRFTVGEANLRSVWTYYYDLPVDFK